MSKRALIVSSLFLLLGCEPPPSIDPDEPDAAALDSGELDSGELDSGELDSGEPDSGEPDSGEPDSGVLDSGVIDSGVPDAGPPDAGPTCILPTRPAIDAGVLTQTPGQWTWTPIAGSRCGSGSTAGIGINPGGSGQDLFLLLQGGGACWNSGTCAPSFVGFGPLCAYSNLCVIGAAGGTEPTAVYVNHPDPFPADGGGAFPVELGAVKGFTAFDRTLVDNPFRDATFVFVPYCTGDIHSGDTTQTYRYQQVAFGPITNRTVHFRGASNMDRYLDYLRARMPNLRRVWVTGISAGGYGATMNFERVKLAFPNAEVHLMADSSPFIHTPIHWPEWKSAWNMQLPACCPGCDAGFPAVMDHLSATSPASRLGLLATTHDKVISYYFFAAPGLDAFLNAPTYAYNAVLPGLEARYDGTANSRYFVVPGEEHVLFDDAFARLADGGVPPGPSDGGVSLRQWVNQWAVGDPAWRSVR